MTAQDLAVYVAIIAGSMGVLASTPPAFKTVKLVFHWLKHHMLSDIYEILDSCTSKRPQ